GKAQVDNVGREVDRDLERLREREAGAPRATEIYRMRPTRAQRRELDVGCNAEDALLIVGRGRDHAGYRRAVHFAARRTPAPLDEVPAEMDPPGELGVVGIDGRIDDRDS